MSTVFVRCWTVRRWMVTLSMSWGAFTRGRFPWFTAREDWIRFDLPGLCLHIGSAVQIRPKGIEG